MERMPLLKKSRCEHDQIIGFCLDCEKGHADALAEALVDAANEMHSYGLVADHWLHGKQVPLSECGYALCVAANEVLAALDKLRGSK